MPASLVIREAALIKPPFWVEGSTKLARCNTVEDLPHVFMSALHRYWPADGCNKMRKATVLFLVPHVRCPVPE